MADEVTANLFKRNGKIKVFKEAFLRDSVNDKTKLDALIGSLIKVQKQVNDALTEIVEAERITTNSSNKTASQDMEVDHDDDDDDDDDDDEGDGNNNSSSSSTKLSNKDSNEPNPKKPKTL